VLPFLFFASLSGSLSDRFSKRSVIVVTRITELFVVSLGVLAFFLESAPLGYFVLFLMATQSALFSPAKYGIIPEIVKKEDISRFNGILTATTYLAIILGTFFASFLTDITERNFVFASFFCIVIAILGAITSLGIEKTLPQAADKKVSARFLSDIYRTLKRAKQVRYLLFTIIFGAYFLFLGAYTQLNIIPFALQSLSLSEIQGGYLFLMTAIGIGIGSFLAGRLSGRGVELGIVPIASLAIVVLLMGLYFFQAHFFVVSTLLVFLGIFGGFFIVPIDAFIQVASPNKNRGENVAAANFLNFLGVILASILLFLFGNVFHLSAAGGFFLMGLLTCALGIALLFLMGDQVVRFLLARVICPFWNLKIIGQHNVSFTPPVLLVGERSSWLDTVIMMATLPRLIRYIVPIEGNYARSRSFLYRLLYLTPIERDVFLATALEEVRRELDLGHSVCLMHPVLNLSKDLTEWRGKLDILLASVTVPVIPVHIMRTSEKKEKLSALFSTPIKVSYGESRKESV